MSIRAIAFGFVLVNAVLVALLLNELGCAGLFVWLASAAAGWFGEGALHRARGPLGQTCTNLHQPAPTCTNAAGPHLG